MVVSKHNRLVNVETRCWAMQAVSILKKKNKSHMVKTNKTPRIHTTYKTRKVGFVLVRVHHRAKKEHVKYTSRQLHSQL